MHPLLQSLGLTVPIIQAPMAGTSTPAMAAAVSNAGGLGSVGAGPADVAATEQMIAQIRASTNRAFNVNVFCNRPAQADPAREAAWIAQLSPIFARFGAQPPAALTEIYRSFVEDDAKLHALVQARPAVVSFHFGLPDAGRINALKQAGIRLFASATSLAEAQAAVEAGVDAVVAQGMEAGGHRGVFEPDGPDARLGTLTLTRLLVRALEVPVIAAGGIMDGAGIAAVLTLGAAAAQLGTAFIGCPESAADPAYREALTGPGAAQTVLTRVISGRPARALGNRFTVLGETLDLTAMPDYPIVYDAGKALAAAAKAAGDGGYGAQWAGQGAPMARTLPAAELVAALAAEMEAAMTQGARS